MADGSDATHRDGDDAAYRRRLRALPLAALLDEAERLAHALHDTRVRLASRAGARVAGRALACYDECARRGLGASLDALVRYARDARRSARARD